MWISPGTVYRRGGFMFLRTFKESPSGTGRGETLLRFSSFVRVPLAADGVDEGPRMNRTELHVTYDCLVNMLLGTTKTTRRHGYMHSRQQQYFRGRWAFFVAACGTKQEKPPGARRASSSPQLVFKIGKDTARYRASALLILAGVHIVHKHRSSFANLVYQDGKLN